MSLNTLSCDVSLNRDCCTQKQGYLCPVKSKLTINSIYKKKGQMNRNIEIIRNSCQKFNGVFLLLFSFTILFTGFTLSISTLDVKTDLSFYIPIVPFLKELLPLFGSPGQVSYCYRWASVCR